MKKSPMQEWAHKEMLRDLELAAEELETEEVEMRYAASQNPMGVMFWLQRKRKKKLEEEAEDNFRIWFSGLVLNFVDFAIMLEEMRDFMCNPKQGKSDPPLEPGNNKPSL